ncbi:unannotated protein [freshwater metagenome]|uniref:Unannotated protein n=1 Tax=freshwater metagenome TaxID=449393 RepID=A0A6J7J5I8_9ZZZZ|nr:phospholipase [Actinomycetota bacterium]
MTTIPYRERPADGEPAGLLILHHGRGSDENDLIGLADVLDPDRRLHVVSPGGPLLISGLPGRHWYVIGTIEHPNPESFNTQLGVLREFHEETRRRTGVGPERTVLGGFSMGGVMSYASGLDPEAPAPAGIFTMGSFFPHAEGFAPDLAGRAATTPVLVTHGRADQVIAPEFGERARDLLQDAGFAVDFALHDGPHRVEPSQATAVQRWIDEVLA